MEYSDEYLSESLPPGFPPEELVPGAVKLEVDGWLERAGSEGSSLISRSVRWTYAMFSELRSNQYIASKSRILVPYWPGLTSIGILDPQHEISGFGVIFTVPSMDEAISTDGELRFPRLNDITVPFLVRSYREVLHLQHPASGTSACWGRCNAQGTWGVMTAGHVVVGASPGSWIKFANGSGGTLLRTEYYPVDASFIQATPPTSPLPLPILHFPASGYPVEVVTQRGTIPRHIARAEDNFGVYKTAQIQIRFSLDNGLQAGDSGSLIRLKTGDAIGLYCSEMRTNDLQYPIVGLAQNFAQAQWALDVSPFL